MTFARQYNRWIRTSPLGVPTVLFLLLVGGCTVNPVPAALALARVSDCGMVRVALAYAPLTDAGHFSGRADGDPFRDRFEIRLTNHSVPVGTEFDYQSPQPLQFFFTIFRKLKDGSLLDVTIPQVDTHHTGQPAPQKLRFDKEGETIVDSISYFAFRTIVPDDHRIAGEYLVRISGFDLLSVGSNACRFDPLDLPLTVVDRDLDVFKRELSSDIRK